MSSSARTPTALAVAIVAIATWLTTFLAPPVADNGRSEGDVLEPPPAESPEPDEGRTDASADAEANVLLVWGHGGTDATFSGRVRTLPGVTAVSAVRVDRRDLLAAVDADGRSATDLPPAWVYPLDTAAIDPGDHEAVLGALIGDLASLIPGAALLTEASAALRGLGPGARLTLADGSEREIIGVVGDRVGGYAELIVHPDDSLAVDIERYLLVRHDGDGDEVAARIRAVASEELRIRPLAETTYPRHGDGVLPQVIIKTHFGEFAMNDVAGRRVQVGASWRREHLESRTLPHVGFTVCHRIVMDAFAAVLAELEERGLLDTLNPRQYQGCWLGRVIGSSRTLSHHSWGLAVDVNVNPADVFTADLHPEVIDVFRAHGFVWGGDFLRPDEPHFEYVGDLLERPEPA